MAYITGADKNQMMLIGYSIDEFIDKDNIARVIEAYVNKLDLEDMGFEIYSAEAAGQRPYDRKELLKLHIYGYMNGIRSSRKLETETHRNIEVKWLLGMLEPDHRTIANFIKDNKRAMKSVLKDFSMLLKEWGLIDGKKVVPDGTKIRAQNSKKAHLSIKKIDDTVKYLENKIEEYIGEMEKAEEAAATINEAIKKEELNKIEDKIKEYRQRAESYKETKKEMEEKGISQVTLTDPDSRMMRNNGRMEVCYNMQIVVDSKNKLIMDCDVVNEVTDQGQLGNMVNKASEILGEKPETVLADTGYYKGEEITKCEEDHIKVYIKKQKSKNSTGNERYSIDNFKYAKEEDKYVCPEGKTLEYAGKGRDKGIEVTRYKCKECNDCPEAKECTTSKAGRTVTRKEYQDILDEVDKRTMEDKELYRERQCIVEHPFGTLKRNLGFTYFLRKGLEAVNAEGALMSLAYDLKRAVNILGIQGIISKIEAI